MGALTATLLLDVWERGQGQVPGERAVTLLAAAGMSAEEAGSRPLGQRDRLLLGLREQLFGGRVLGVADCPACGERLEADFESSALRASMPGTAPSAPLRVESEAYSVEFRLPTTADVLAAASAASDDVEAARLLLERCIERAERDGVAVPTAGLPARCQADVAAALAASDPGAEMEVLLSCPGCGETSPVPFDVTAFIWQEITAWARRTLWEVHTLAVAYGWAEGDILGLSASRRRRYIRMVTG
jgi:hypothetical protein